VQLEIITWEKIGHFQTGPENSSFNTIRWAKNITTHFFNNRDINILMTDGDDNDDDNDSINSCFFCYHFKIPKGSVRLKGQG
jgi:hypothetical protein